ncbi:MAG: phosphoribosylformylglycinamidine synthase I [Ardenticatenales bacterium]|nr:phosphoribosylformylglycinamidine synthase I [Ardenticatenales bacterium]
MSRTASPRICILKADGTNCEVETATAFDLVGARPEIVPMNRLRSGERRLADYDVLVAPGGFSYGDDVAAGKVMAVELMQRLADDMAEFAAAAKPIIGICNGFQVLVRTGLLPFNQPGIMSATLAQNAVGRFECRWVDLVVEAATVSQLAAALPSHLQLPLAHAEGRFFADDAVLARIEAAHQVVLRYADRDGRPTAAYPANPNGALGAIAGLSDPSGRIFGLMPHPERFVRRFHHPDWRRRPADERPHGLAFFERIVALA